MREFECFQLLLCFRKYIICDVKPNSQVLQCAFIWIWAAKTQSYFPAGSVPSHARGGASSPRLGHLAAHYPLRPLPVHRRHQSAAGLSCQGRRIATGEEKNLISRHDPGSRWVRKGMLEQNFYHFSFFLFGFAGRWRRNGQLPGKDTAVPLASYTMTLNHRIFFLFFHCQRQPSTKKIQPNRALSSTFITGNVLYTLQEHPLQKVTCVQALSIFKLMALTEAPTSLSQLFNIPGFKYFRIIRLLLSLYFCNHRNVLLN